MTKKKVNLVYIDNDSARKATFKKRRKGLLKKVEELSTLCGIDACAVLYSPFGDQPPDVYPPAHAGGPGQVLARFAALPGEDKAKKMLTHEDFLRQRIAKASDQLRRLHHENRAKELAGIVATALGSPDLGAVLEGLTAADLDEVSALIDKNMADVGRQIEKIAAAKEEEEDEAEGSDFEGVSELPWFLEWTTKNHDDNEGGRRRSRRGDDNQTIMNMREYESL